MSGQGQDALDAPHRADPSLLLSSRLGKLHLHEVEQAAAQQTSGLYTRTYGSTAAQQTARGVPMCMPATGHMLTSTSGLVKAPQAPAAQPGLIAAFPAPVAGNYTSTFTANTAMLAPPPLPPAPPAAAALYNNKPPPAPPSATAASVRCAQAKAAAPDVKQEALPQLAVTCAPPPPLTPPRPPTLLVYVPECVQVSVLERSWLALHMVHHCCKKYSQPRLDTTLMQQLPHHALSGATARCSARLRALPCAFSSCSMHLATATTLASAGGAAAQHVPWAVREQHQECPARMTALCGPAGALRSPAFRALHWLDGGGGAGAIQPASLSDLLRVHEHDYIALLQVSQINAHHCARAEQPVQ
jgi:hypothetical protein